MQLNRQDAKDTEDPGPIHRSHRCTQISDSSDRINEIYGIQHFQGRTGLVIDSPDSLLSSPLDPEQVMTELASAAFIRLDDLFFRDNQNRVRPWSERGALMQPKALINCKNISAVMPLASDPFQGQPPEV